MSRGNGTDSTSQKRQKAWVRIARENEVVPAFIFFAFWSEADSKTFMYAIRVALINHVNLYFILKIIRLLCERSIIYIYKCSMIINCIVINIF